MANVIKTLPKYGLGSVIDLKSISGQLPDRIRIDMIYMKDTSDCWMYQATSELYGETFYREDKIVTSSKTQKCYKNPIVTDKFDKGFRFAGNLKRDEALKYAKSLRSKCDCIDKVVVDLAVFPNGSQSKDGNTLGVWVRYNTSIRDSGDTVKNHDYKSGGYPMEV